MLLRHVEGPPPVRFVGRDRRDPVDALDGGPAEPAPLRRPFAQTGPPAAAARARRRRRDPRLRDPRGDRRPTSRSTRTRSTRSDGTRLAGNTRELREVLRRGGEALLGDTIGPLGRAIRDRPRAAPRARARRKPPVVKIAVGDSLADVERR
jgi:hypothetical protein